MKYLMFVIEHWALIVILSFMVLIVFGSLAGICSNQSLPPRELYDEDEEEK